MSIKAGFRIRIRSVPFFFASIHIRIRFSNFSGSGSGIEKIMDPDPVCPERLDPDPNPVFHERLDPDLVNFRPDPKPWV